MSQTPSALIPDGDEKAIEQCGSCEETGQNCIKHREQQRPALALAEADVEQAKPSDGATLHNPVGGSAYRWTRNG